MELIDYAGIATIIRGLWINTSVYPWVVMYSLLEQAEEIPPDAFIVDIVAALRNDHTIDEDIAAKIFREAYTAWKFEIAPGGVEAAVKTETMRKQPSCVVVKNNDEIKAFYWIDRNLDSVGKRMKEKNASLLEEKLPHASIMNYVPGVNAAHRAEVVKNKIALVTGGAQGFGKEIVQSLAESGALVFIADLNKEGAEKLAKTINTAYKRTAAIPLEVDVSNEGSVQRLFESVVETAGGLDICISNAGVVKAGSVLEQNLDDFKFVTDVNYTGFFLVAKHAALLFRRQHRTAPAWKTDIIQINSKSGLEGSNKNSAYSGGKFGSLGLVASFALELVEYNIKVNAVCPGNFFDGPLWSDPEQGLFVQYLKTGKVPGAKQIADVKAYYEAKIPMKRGCTGVDVMWAIYYIIEQAYETGQAVPVTGGQVMLH
ncbi:MAG: SDR family NAD(P)-dependent oxidoreductase [Treponema sp.]|jgi:sorbitol-6-phosphate 2-dehydrogenase|nr:SDR family NAD(P)-dependent oxidoreductase [Treponema sp.]